MTKEEEAESRGLISVNPGMWFEAFGAIEPKIGAIKQWPDLKATILQKRKAEVVRYCLLNGIPCRLISLKSRQDGSSTFSVAIAYRYLGNARGNGCIVGGSHAQGTNLFRKLKFFASHDTFTPENPCKSLDRSAGWANGSTCEQFTAGNPEVGRSGTYQVVVCTEVARWSEEGVANAADVLVGLLKCVPNQPKTFVELESTARGASGDFYDRWNGGITFEELQQGKRGFVKIFAAWFENPERRMDPALEVGREQCVPPDKVDELRRKYGLEEDQIAWMQWAVREECKKDFDTFCEDYPFDAESAFRTSGRRRFNGKILEKMVNRSRSYPPNLGNLSMVDGRPVWIDSSSSEARILRWESPKENYRYLLSADTMTGETQVGGKDPDNHAVGVLRAGFYDPDRGWVPPMLVARLVHDYSLWERSAKYELRWDIDVLEDQIWKLAQYYGNCLIVPEINMDRGVVELLKLRPGANIILRPQFNRREMTEQKAYGWKTDPSTREIVIENLARAIREDGQTSEGVTIYCPITLSELQSFVVKNSGRSEAMPGKKDDCVLQLAIGLYTITGATTFSRRVVYSALPPDLAALEAQENSVAGLAHRW